MNENKHYETFQAFIERHPRYQPVKHEEMTSVYRKQHEAFIAYVNEQVAAKLAEIDEVFSGIHNNGTSKT